MTEDEHGSPPPRMRAAGHPAAAYTWHVALGGVLVVVDLDRDGWRSVTNDAAGVVADLAEVRRCCMDPHGAWNRSGVGGAPSHLIPDAALLHGPPWRLKPVWRRRRSLLT